MAGKWKAAKNHKSKQGKIKGLTQLSRKILFYLLFQCPKKYIVPQANREPLENIGDIMTYKSLVGNLESNKSGDVKSLPIKPRPGRGKGHLPT